MGRQELCAVEIKTNILMKKDGQQSMLTEKKPKMMNNKQPIMESIISTINIEKTEVKKEAAKAVMELPTRENRYTLTEEIIRQETEEIASTRIQNSMGNR